MKTITDPRHLRRIRILQALYSQQFTGTKVIPLPPVERPILEEINNNLVRINIEIDKFATKFPTNKMSKMDLSILQLGIYELLINNHEPYKVILDESIELAKEFGAIKSSNFINGILGKLVENLKI